MSSNPPRPDLESLATFPQGVSVNGRAPNYTAQIQAVARYALALESRLLELAENWNDISALIQDRSHKMNRGTPPRKDTAP